MDNLFHIIEDAQIVLRSRGVFRQEKLFRRGQPPLRKVGAGFIRIGAGDATSCPHVSYETMKLPENIVIERGQIGEPLLAAQKQELRATRRRR